MNNLSAEEDRARRLLRKQGLRLWKVRPNSRSYAEYGTYPVIDVSINGVVAAGYDDVSSILADYAERDSD